MGIVNSFREAYQSRGLEYRNCRNKLSSTQHRSTVGAHLDQHTISISIACEYGTTTGDVTTSLRYDCATKIFTLKVLNLPGYGHDNLCNLSREEIRHVFVEGAQLQSNQCSGTEEGKLVSAGSAVNGAWIQPKSAQCGGRCTIQFESNGTLFESTGTLLTCRCPASVCDCWEEKDQVNEKKMSFTLPEYTFVAVVERSAMQSTHLLRFLKDAGVAACRCVSLGKDALEIRTVTGASSIA